MTTTVKNTETEKEESKFGNIKRLNALKTQGELSALLNNIKSARRKIDGIIGEFKERERAVERMKREEQQKKAEAAAPQKQPLPLPPKEDRPEPVPAVQAQPVKAEESDKKETAAPAPKAEPTIRTKQFDTTPSYIRGVMKPIPPRPPQSISRPTGPVPRTVRRRAISDHVRLPEVQNARFCRAPIWLRLYRTIRVNRLTKRKNIPSPTTTKRA